MRSVILFLLAMIFAGCSQNPDPHGIVYSGKANLNMRVRQFTATNAVGTKDILLAMTGPRELTFSFNKKVSHIDYEKDVIIFRSDTDNSEWTAKKVRGGFELEDGTFLQYRKCDGWNICLLDGSSNQPILKGRFSLSGGNTNITLWISDGEKHVELLGLMANALLNRSRNARQLIESSIETISPQIWTY